MSRPQVSWHLGEWKRMVSEHASLNGALVSTIYDGGDGYFATNSLERLKNIVRDEVGIKLDLRTCRGTFGQLLLDRERASRPSRSSWPRLHQDHGELLLP